MHYEPGTAGYNIIAYLVRYYAQDEAAMQALNGWDLDQLRRRLDSEALEAKFGPR